MIFPTGGVTITGVADEDEVLTADTSTLADGDGLGTLSYQWSRDGSPIDGATSSTHTLTQEDVGAEITVEVSYTDGEGASESVTSAATSASDECQSFTNRWCNDHRHSNRRRSSDSRYFNPG